MFISTVDSVKSSLYLISCDKELLLAKMFTLSMRREFIFYVGPTKGTVTDPDLAREWSIVRSYNNILRQKEFEINDVIARLRAGQPLPVALSAVSSLNLTNNERSVISHYEKEMKRIEKNNSRSRLGFWGAFFSFLAYIFIAAALGLTIMYAIHMIY